MGMSASQARLLTLTSRLHDIELKAQHLQAQKIALATQRDGVSKEYCDALEATAFKVNLGTNGERKFVAANYNSLCTYHEGVPRNYVMIDNKSGKVLVNQETADKYKQYGSDKYAFAFAMMGIMPKDNDYSRLGGSYTVLVSNNNNNNKNTSSSKTSSGHYVNVEKEIPGETHTYTYYTGSISAEVYQEDHRNADQEVQGSRRTLSVDISLEDEMTSENACMQKFYDGFDSELIPDYGCDWCVDMSTLSKNISPETKTVKDPPKIITEKVWVEDESEVTDEGDNDDDPMKKTLEELEAGDEEKQTIQLNYAMTETEEKIYNDLINSGNDYSSLKGKYETFNNATEPKEKKKAYAEFRKELMKVAAEQIFEELANQSGKDAEWDKAEFNHYTQLWDAIEESGGIEVIEPQYEGGEDGTAWFKNSVESGNVLIRSYGESGHAGEWSDTSFATSTNSNWLQEVNDTTKEKIAEIKYNEEMRKINDKDTKFDTELKNLETERTAITTEIDSVKKAKDDNIERTFGIFS